MKKIEMGSRSRSGQATIEYLLVIVVIISIAIMFKIINDKYIRPYLNYALGAYIECLLETGQLPFVGSDSSAKSDYNNATSDRKVNLSSSGLAEEEVSCRFDSNQINIKAAQEAATAGQSSESAKNSGSNSNNFKSNNASSSSNSKSNSNETTGGGNSSSSRGGGGSGPGSGSAFSNSRPAVRKSTAIGTAEAGQNSTIYIDEGGGEESSNRRRRRRIASKLEEQASKKVIAAPQNKEIAEDKKVIPAGEEGSSTMTKRPVNLPPERRAASLDSQDDTSLGFGGLLKLFLIAGIIIAIVVFFGGQIMNYNNSREK